VGKPPGVGGLEAKTPEARGLGALPPELGNFSTKITHFRHI